MLTVDRGPHEFCDSNGICEKRRSSDSESLSPGAIAGIVIGSIIGLVLLIICLCLIFTNTCSNDSNPHHCEPKGKAYTISHNRGTSQHSRPQTRPNNIVLQTNVKIRG